MKSDSMAGFPASWIFWGLGLISYLFIHNTENLSDFVFGNDKEQAINLAKKYKEMAAEKLPLKALYFYGSYSKGNYKEDSDIDIAVVVDRLNDNYFEDTPVLWQLRRKISNLIEPVLLTEDMNNPLYRDITKTGILI